MDFLSDTVDDGVRERRFVLGVVPGVLFSPSPGGPAGPLVLLAHGGGQHTGHPAVLSRARRYAGTCGFTSGRPSATGQQSDGAGSTATVTIETMAWPTIEALEAVRVRLEPLAVDHATQMVEVLPNPALYRFIGGHPPTLRELMRRYAAQAVGHSEDQTQWWLNWIVMSRAGVCAIDYVQATVEHRGAALEASIAWVIAPDFQGHGLATEAAGALLDWLKAHGVGLVVAYVHPAHAASQAVTRKLGLRPTSLIEDGEIRWQSFPH